MAHPNFSHALSAHPSSSYRSDLQTRQPLVHLQSHFPAGHRIRQLSSATSCDVPEPEILESQPSMVSVNGGKQHKSKMYVAEKNMIFFSFIF